MTKISTDICYLKPILNYIFKCKTCGSQLLMFGCENVNCENLQYNNLKNGIQGVKLNEHI